MCRPQQFPTAFCWWTCPLCGKTQVNVRKDERCRSAENNLRAHIRNTDDQLHGIRGSYPPNDALADLSEYIICPQ